MGAPNFLLQSAGNDSSALSQASDPPLSGSTSGVHYSLPVSCDWFRLRALRLISTSNCGCFWSHSNRRDRYRLEYPTANWKVHDMQRWWKKEVVSSRPPRNQWMKWELNKRMNQRIATSGIKGPAGSARGLMLDWVLGLFKMTHICIRAPKQFAVDPTEI